MTFSPRFLIGIFIFLTAPGLAQDLDYARQMVTKLSAPDMHGRGYVSEGDKVAANFIAQQLEESGAQPIGKSFFQPFDFQINTFPGKMEVTLGKAHLTPGEDYLCMPFSSSAKGSFKVVRLDSSIVNHRNKLDAFRREHLPDKFVLVDKRGIEDKDQLKFFESMIYNPIKAKGIIVVTDEKLTHGMSREAFGHAALIVKRSSLPKEIKKIKIQLESRHFDSYITRNVIGMIKGSTVPDSFLVFTAHYDHLGRMGTNTYFPGANDNASGTAMILDLVRYYRDHPPKYSVAFMFFSAEEVGILGSKYYTENPLFPVNKIKFLLNLDLMGNGDEGITVVNGSVHKREFDLLSKINTDKDYVMKVKSRGKAANSDHYFFSEQGVPAFFIYTLGKHKAYHDIEDTAENLPLVEYVDLVKLIVDFAQEL